MMAMDHYFPNVPQLGNVAVSRHAQDRMREDGISEAAFRDVLATGDIVPDGQDVVWREKDGIRIVIFTAFLGCTGGVEVSQRGVPELVRALVPVHRAFESELGFTVSIRGIVRSGFVNRLRFGLAVRRRG